MSYVNSIGRQSFVYECPSDEPTASEISFAEDTAKAFRKHNLLKYGATDFPADLKYLVYIDNHPHLDLGDVRDTVGGMVYLSQKGLDAVMADVHDKPFFPVSIYELVSRRERKSSSPNERVTEVTWKLKSKSFDAQRRPDTEVIGQAFELKSKPR